MKNASSNKYRKPLTKQLIINVIVQSMEGTFYPKQTMKAQTGIMAKE
jgi:hypothetical protein